MSKRGALVYTLIMLSLYIVGFSSGKSQALKTYLKEQEAYKEALEEVRRERREDLQNHIAKQQQFEIDLVELRTEHEARISNLRSEYAGRLRQSEERSDMYRRRVSSASIECRALAEHTSGLDRALTEGRELARELRERLEQSQLAFNEVVSYLVADREHLNRL